jgi:hypothetical protein
MPNSFFACFSQGELSVRLLGTYRVTDGTTLQFQKDEFDYSWCRSKNRF